MAERVFVDTNVLVYAYDRKERIKRPRARSVLSDLIRARSAVVSTQVLQEFFAASVQKLKLPADQARRYVEQLTQLDIVVVRPELILAAIDLHRLHRVAFWDALIIKSASAAGCARVLTEDLNDGQVIDGVRIENPF